MMGTSLYNKIYLGRPTLLESRGKQAAIMLGTFASIGLAWLVLRTLR
jgi:hypothetical protein